MRFNWPSFQRKRAPLSGAPEVRRQKTYSAQSGYVYQYYYEGYRPFQDGHEHGLEYVFDVSADRKTSIAVSVRVSDAALELWQGAHQRELSSTERYAIAKMSLFQAFDEREHPAQMKHEVQVRPADVDAILASLDID